MNQNADQIEFNLDVHNEDNDDNDDENDDNDDDMIADDDSANNNNQDDVIDGGVASDSLGQIQASDCPVVSKVHVIMLCVPLHISSFTALMCSPTGTSGIIHSMPGRLLVLHSHRQHNIYRTGENNETVGGV